jgi:hypothetical protein
MKTKGKAFASLGALLLASLPIGCAEEKKTAVEPVVITPGMENMKAQMIQANKKALGKIPKSVATAPK